MDHRIGEIKGLAESFKAQLQERQIDTVEDLLTRTAGRADRERLARDLGVEPAQLTEWINRADLMRLNGVGAEYANLLEECGVDSCKELQHRVPDNLHAKLTEVNAAKRIVERAPGLAQVRAWIDEAATFAKG
jgi:hypothetical protein